MKPAFVRTMATISFLRPMIIKDDKAAAALIKAANRTHKPIRKIDISRELESGLASLKKRYSH
jgi:hypothetical protein